MPFRSWQIHYMFHRFFTSCALAGNTPFQSLQIAKSPELLQIHHAKSRFLLRDLHRLGPKPWGFPSLSIVAVVFSVWLVGWSQLVSYFFEFMIRILGESKIRLWLSSSSIKKGEIVRWIPLLCILYKLLFGVSNWQSRCNSSMMFDDQGWDWLLSMRVVSWQLCLTCPQFSK